MSMQMLVVSGSFQYYNYGVVIIQLTDGRRVGECFGSDSLSVDVC
jgi:hypothetical protein